MQDIERIIEKAFDNRADGFENKREVEAAVAEAIALLDSGAARVAEPMADGWHVNQWLKKAVLLSFGLAENKVVEGGHTRFYDKVPTKYAEYTAERFAADGVRVVPDAVVRRGSYVAQDVVLMPSFVNIGAYVDSGTMVDTWATVGSCAQIGRNVHLSGGVGIGGVLEPIQAGPTIIEDDCFIGARSEVVEGVVVERGSVISMGVYLGRAPESTTGTVGKSAMAEFRPDLLSSLETCRRVTENTPYIAQSSSRRSMRRHAQKLD